MLSYRLLKNHAGVLLIGDYLTLRSLHEVVHDVNDRSPIIQTRNTPFLALAYDVRKAYEGRRDVIPPPVDCPEMGAVYGVEILWPVLLIQHRTLRASLAYIDHGKRHQAIVYCLEAVIEAALADAFGRSGKAIVEAWEALDATRKDVYDRLDSRGGLFCSWTKAERKRHLASLLDSFHPLYEALYDMRVNRGDPDLISPEDIERWAGREWLDPRGYSVAS